MKYSVDELASEYLKVLESTNFDIDRPYLPEFNFDAYNDNEYINCIKELTNDYDKVNDLEKTETFLSQNSFDNHNI